jgi:hypothetical protein
MLDVWGEAHTWFWWGAAEGKRKLGRPGHRWKHNIKVDFKKQAGKAETGLMWFMKNTSDGL